MASPPRLLIPLLAALLLPARGETPWAVQVVSYQRGVNYEEFYILPESALGRPTIDTYEDSVAAVPTVAVVPVYPAWDPGEIVSIGGGGHLVLRMGAPIRNHPDNPYGVDLLVFGNSMIFGTDVLYNPFANSPEGYTLASESTIATNSKNGGVSVSADGVTWFSFTHQPRLGFPPTLGRLWENGAWGAPADPTVPPDPRLHVRDLAGMPLTELLARYRGGAGGTGLDLSNLAIPPGVTPPSEFWYVRIEVPAGQLRTEIDAVTVVRPATERRRWEIRHFAWLQSPAVERQAVGVHFAPGRVPALLHPEQGELPGWILEWSPSPGAPDWRDAAAVPPSGPAQFFRARQTGDTP
jgi:hypothetical protein